MSLLALSGTNSVSGGYDIENSLKFETDNSEYLKAEGRSQGDSQQTWTWSCWLKRTEVNNGVVAQYIFSAGSDGKLGLYFRDDSSSNGGDTIFIYVDEGNSLKWIGELRVSFRDTSAWYHIVFAVDSTDSTAADRTKIYVNGVQQTITFNSTLNQNVSTRVGDNGGKFSIGAKMDGSYGFNGYMAECVLVDGSALTPTSFGEYDEDSGIWKPKDVSDLSLGTTGFHMNFDDSSNVGAVQIGTSQGNFDKYNLSAADQAVDTPTNNFCTLLSTSPSASYYKRVKDGGTSFQSVTNAWASCWSSIPLYSGKWYAEFKRTSAGTGGNVFIGAGGIDQNLYYYNIIFVGHNGTGTTFSVGLYSLNGDFYSGTGVTGSSYATGDIICMAVDQDNEAIYFRKNDGAWMGDGTNAGDPSSGASRTGAQIIDWGTATNLAISNYANGDETEANYGGYSCMSNSRTYTDDNGHGLFVFEPPTGYLAICSKNLAEYG